MDRQLETAYSVCRGVARTQARNFYYGFLPLPKHKRNALCAVYAFMRHADDISDESTVREEERQRRLANWFNDWRKVEAGAATNDPIFFALADAQRRFSIPSTLLEQLVSGTAMDLQADRNDAQASRDNGAAATAALPAVKLFRTFNDLYQYCYYVASVVGLVCIHIYGYNEAKAEQLAEKLGVAFQLTNIIRDVKEDAAMGRVYLPAEDLARFGFTADDFLRDGGASLDQARLWPLLQFEAERARELYKAADELLPLIHRDSRSALWVMSTIYRRLLEKMAGRNFDVLHGRVRLSSWEKLALLSRGLLQSFAS